MHKILRKGQDQKIKAEGKVKVEYGVGCAKGDGAAVAKLRVGVGGGGGEVGGVAKVNVEVEVEVRGVSVTLRLRGIALGLVVVLSQWTVVTARTGCSFVSPRCLVSSVACRSAGLTCKALSWHFARHWADLQGGLSFLFPCFHKRFISIALYCYQPLPLRIRHGYK
jgi:hypothetical protein